jgi:hypothetical protein
VRVAEFTLPLKKFPIDGGTDLFAISDFKLPILTLSERSALMGGQIGMWIAECGIGKMEDWR